MASPLRTLFGARRDPWWDLEGKGVRRRRFRRQFLEIGVAVLGVALALMLLGAVEARAASTTVNLDQWASLDRAWQNGNLNGNNSRFPEGGVVPFRLAVEGLKPGSHTIHINYDFTAGGHKAYDFLATWNAWASPAICGGSGGGISSMCPNLPSPSTRTFPSDPFVADGLPVRAAENYAAAPRQLTIWGGTITSISGPVHSGPVSGNSTADFTVRFTSSGSAVLLAWGGHLAQSRFWNMAAGGQRDGAGEVSGAPWHMRTLQLDGTGNKNQDRSIQPSAIVGELPPFAYAPPTPTPQPTAPPRAPGATPRPGGGDSSGPGSPGGGPGAPTGGRANPTPPPTHMTPEERHTTDDNWDGAFLFLALIGGAVGVGFAIVLARPKRRDT